jgi:prepilin-type N-terminal cleavage/methylation domain-containing protein
MRSRLKRKSSGFSLIELLVVVAIIGVLSLISVPAFMNFRRSNDFKTGMRNFATDLRNARASAIANSFDVRCDVQIGSITLKQYKFYSSRDNGTTWTPLQLRGTGGAAGNMKQFAFSVWADSSTGLPDADGNGNPDIVFHPNGAMTLAGGSTAATIVLATDWKKINFDRYTINLSPSGQFKAVGSHT